MKSGINLAGAAIALGLCIATPLTAVADNGHKRVRESVEVANHLDFVTHEVLNGATVLVRDFKDKTITANISTGALQPLSAYSIWWAIFNRPGHCTVPYSCALVDLGNPLVKASVFWGGGFVTDSDGVANTTIRIRRGRTDRELFAGTKDYGLQDLRGAEIHVVGRDHGPIGGPGSVAQQVGTAMLACPDGGCKNVFASIHIAGETEAE